MPFISIFLALVVVGSVAYLAWEITKEAMIEHDKTKHDDANDDDTK